MFAVIVTGGKQYRVQEGDVLRIERLEAEAGSEFQFDRVLLLGQGSEIKIGRPTLPDSQVRAEVVGHGRGKKIEIIKFRRRKHYQKRTGHRQDYTEVRITGIVA